MCVEWMLMYMYIAHRFVYNQIGLMHGCSLTTSAVYYAVWGIAENHTVNSFEYFMYCLNTHHVHKCIAIMKVRMLFPWCKSPEITTGRMNQVMTTYIPPHYTQYVRFTCGQQSHHGPAKLCSMFLCRALLLPTCAFSKDHKRSRLVNGNSQFKSMWQCIFNYTQHTWQGRN